jgi:hypothetical protein
MPTIKLIATMAEWVEAMKILSHDEAWCAGGRKDFLI